MNRSYYDMPVERVTGRISGNQHPNLDTAGSHIAVPHPRRRLQYEHEPTRPARARSPVGLHVPTNNPGPRGVLSPFDCPRRRRRRCSDSDSAQDRPPRCARSAIRDTFTDSCSGVGVGILCALVGGLVAHEVSHTTTVRAPNKKAPDDEKRRPDPSGDGDDKSRRLATLAGAVVGGLGANAIEKRFEVSRQRRRESRIGRWGEEGGIWQNE